MNIKWYQKTVWMILLLTGVSALSGCSNDDDVLDIFVGGGKTWKLTFISRENENQWYNFWGSNETAHENSLKAMEGENNFILNFESGANDSGVNGGGLSGRGIKTTLTGTWSATDSRELKITLQGNPSETDPVAKAFVAGRKGAKRYEGDSENLYIIYTEGQTNMRMSFHVKK